MANDTLENAFSGRLSSGIAACSFLRDFANDRGTVAGNGGQKAGKTEEKQKRANEKEKKARCKADGAPSVKTTARARAKAGVDAVAEASVETVVAANDSANEKTPAVGAGTERLHTRANKTVGQNSGTITRLLLGNTVGGNLDSAKLLLTLAETKNGQKGKEKKRKGRSLALMLASEPEWRGEQTESAAEPGGESLEPKG